MTSESLRLFAASFLLGLSVAAPIGPVNIEIIRRGLTFGPLAALALGLGAVSADCVYFAVAFAATDLASAILESPWGMRIGWAMGGTMLGWIAYLTLRSAVGQAAGLSRDTSSLQEIDRPAACPTPARTYAVGLLMTLSNPMTIAFWLSIAVSLRAGSEHSSPLLRLAGVGSGALSWVLFLVTVLSLARRWVTPRSMRWINIASGCVLVGFALRFWVKAAF